MVKEKLRKEEYKTGVLKRGQTLMLLSLLIITGCISSSTATPTSISTAIVSYTPSIEAFGTSDQCPHFCWMGIHPGKTSAEEALRRIRNSDQFNQPITQQNDQSIEARWYTEKTKKFGASVYITVSGDIVKSIRMGKLMPFTVDFFIHLYGEPSEISFWVGKDIHNYVFTIYTIYYPSTFTSLKVHINGVRGPDPNDMIEVLEAGTEINDDSFQPWLGYGVAEKYFSRGTPIVHPPGQ